MGFLDTALVHASSTDRLMSTSVAISQQYKLGVTIEDGEMDHTRIARWVLGRICGGDLQSLAESSADEGSIVEDRGTASVASTETRTAGSRLSFGAFGCHGEMTCSALGLQL